MFPSGCRGDVAGGVGPIVQHAALACPTVWSPGPSGRQRVMVSRGLPGVVAGLSSMVAAGGRCSDGSDVDHAFAAFGQTLVVPVSTGAGSCSVCGNGSATPGYVPLPTGGAGLRTPYAGEGRGTTCSRASSFSRTQATSRAPIGSVGPDQPYARLNPFPNLSNKNRAPSRSPCRGTGQALNVGGVNHYFQQNLPPATTGGCPKCPQRCAACGP